MEEVPPPRVNFENSAAYCAGQVPVVEVRPTDRGEPGHVQDCQEMYMKARTSYNNRGTYRATRILIRQPELFAERREQRERTYSKGTEHPGPSKMSRNSLY